MISGAAEVLGSSRIAACQVTIANLPFTSGVREIPAVAVTG